jgi:Domain of unknown function (DUF927)
MTLEQVCSLLDNVRSNGSGYGARCPAHADQNNSLSVSESDDGKILVQCFTGCSFDAIVEAMGLQKSDFFPERNGASGLTVATLAAFKKLPLDFLTGLGLEDCTYNNRPAVHMPYRSESGELLLSRYRVALDGKDKFRNKKGQKLQLYGLDRLARIREAQWCLIVEGESDCWAGWFYGLPVLGVPGINAFKPEWKDFFDGLSALVWQEPGAETFTKKISQTLSNIRVIVADGFKDISEIHVKGTDVATYIERVKESAKKYKPEIRNEWSGGRYGVKDGGLVHWKQTRDGIVANELSNFSARISEELALDDGAEVTRAFVLEGALRNGARLPAVKIPANKFPAMSWVTESLGNRAIVYAGGGTKDYLREAIQQLSILPSGPRERTIYVHTGWREVNGKWIYLSGTQDGLDYEVNLGPELFRYGLPSTIDDAVGAMRVSLKLLRIAPTKVMAPLFSACYRAPLSSIYFPDLGLWLEGKTGSLKSTISSLFLSHFGNFTRTTLPGSWSSTANQLERRSFILKDSLFIIDDYAPGPLDSRELQSKAARIFRGQGNQSARGRLRSDLTERPAFIPRGMVLSTGESHPAGQSLLARIVILPLESSTINFSLLSELQTLAGRLSHSLAGYVSWLAPQMPTLSAKLKETFEEARTRATKESQHKRIPEASAHLWIGLNSALQYGQEIGAIENSEANELAAECWNAFLEIGDDQTAIVNEEKPVRRFLVVLHTLIAQRRAVIIPRIDETKYKNAAVATPELKAGVDFLGWFDTGFLYLIPEAAFNAVVKFCRDSGEPFAIREETCRRELKDEGVSITDKGRLTATKWINGKSERVLTLNIKVIESRFDVKEWRL